MTTPTPKKRKARARKPRVHLMRLRYGDGSLDPGVFAVVANRRAANRLMKELELDNLRVASDFDLEPYAVHQ